MYETLSETKKSEPTRPDTTETSDVSGLVDHLFRHEAGRMVAALARSFGPANLPMVEEVVQDALVQALKRWPFHGIPDNPSAWLYRVARNMALDRLRRGKTFTDKEEQIRSSFEDAMAASESRRIPDAPFRAEITDDQLRLIFLCCHPELPIHGRIALTLKLVMGLGVDEIAGALRSKSTAVAQRITRAQRKIRSESFAFEMPKPDEMPERLDAVLSVLYLAFNEGYSTFQGEELLRRDLCFEALRLTEQLAEHQTISSPSIHALASLMHFHVSRLPTRVDDHGELVLLEDQDRNRWDGEHLRRAFRRLGLATAGNEETVYHLQAAIAAEHAMASHLDRTDWSAIVHYYNRLLRLDPSPIVGLNRAVALGRLEGAERGLDEIQKLEDHPSIQDYYLLGATRGRLLLEADRPAEAMDALESALACPCSEPERRFMQHQLRQAAERLAAVGN